MVPVLVVSDAGCEAGGKILRVGFQMVVGQVRVCLSGLECRPSGRRKIFWGKIVDMALERCMCECECECECVCLQDSMAILSASTTNSKLHFRAGLWCIWVNLFQPNV